MKKVKADKKIFKVIEMLMNVRIELEKKVLYFTKARRRTIVNGRINYVREFGASFFVPHIQKVSFTSKYSLQLTECYRRTQLSE